MKMKLKYFVVLVYLIAVIHYASPRNVNHFYHAETSTRIVGGTEAPERGVPHMVAMVLGAVLRSFLCGGSVVTKRHVLTAAHCIDAVTGYGGLFSSLRVVVGTNRWQYGGRPYIVAGNITNEKWDSETIKNDIGILITSIDIQFTDRIQPVPLHYGYIEGGVTARVAGWGRVKTGGTVSSRLLVLFVQTLDAKECATTLNNPNLRERKIVYDSGIELCAFHSKDHGVCNGDSGSALLRMDTQEQIGIVSWGYECAQGVPDVYVRLSSYKEWLEKKLLR